MYSVIPVPGRGSGQSNLRRQYPGSDTKASGTSCQRNDSVKQMMVGLLVVSWMFEVHTFMEKGEGAADSDSECGKE